jgi:phospholipid-binding lipoprotein MlaA
VRHLSPDALYPPARSPYAAETLELSGEGSQLAQKPRAAASGELAMRMSRTLQCWATLALLMVVSLPSRAGDSEYGLDESTQRSLPPVSLATEATDRTLVAPHRPSQPPAAYTSGVEIATEQSPFAPDVLDADASVLVVVEAVEAVEVADDVDDPLLDAEFDEGFESGDQQIVSDPFEKMNRVLFKFNRSIHKFVLSPITKSYRFVVPELARRGVRRVLINLNSPSILVNDMLQLRFRDAGETLGRFVLNSTVGFGGLFDVGVEAGWDAHSADFGQTLARIGVVSGPYLVVPILGPNTLRDGVGDMVDILFQPLTYLVGPSLNLFIGGGRGFVELETKASAMEALEGSSVDYYAALRSAYIQNRNAEVGLPSERGFD